MAALRCSVFHCCPRILQVAREIPWIMRNYQLEEITTASKLRSQLADIFRARKTENSKAMQHLTCPERELGARRCASGSPSIVFLGGGRNCRPVPR